MTKAKQASLFSQEQEIETLPLFSGTPQTVKVQPFNPEPYVRQASFICPICQDTGRLNYRNIHAVAIPCTCGASPPAPAAKSQPTTRRQKVGTLDHAYPFEYCKHTGECEWRVWRPDRTPHHYGRYATEEQAQRSADRINASLT